MADGNYVHLGNGVVDDQSPRQRAQSARESPRSRRGEAASSRDPTRAASTEPWRSKGPPVSGRRRGLDAWPKQSDSELADVTLSHNTRYQHAMRVMTESAAVAARAGARSDGARTLWETREAQIDGMFKQINRMLGNTEGEKKDNSKDNSKDKDKDKAVRKGVKGTNGSGGPPSAAPSPRAPEVEVDDDSWWKDFVNRTPDATFAARNELERKLQTLRLNPELMEELGHRVEGYKKVQAGSLRQATHGQRRFVKLNKDRCNYFVSSPMARIEQLRERLTAREAHRLEVLEKHQQREQEAQSKKVATWTTKQSLMNAREQRLSAEELAKRHTRAKVLQDWSAVAAVVARVAVLKQLFHDFQYYKIMIEEQRQAVRKISDWWVNILDKRQRNRQARWKGKLNKVALNYISGLRARMKFRCSALILTFLQDVQDSNKVVVVVKNFRKMVVKAQGFWRARVAAYEQRYNTILLQWARYESHVRPGAQPLPASPGGARGAKAGDVGAPSPHSPHSPTRARAGGALGVSPRPAPHTPPGARLGSARRGREFMAASPLSTSKGKKGRGQVPKDIKIQCIRRKIDKWKFEFRAKLEDFYQQRAVYKTRLVMEEARMKLFVGNAQAAAASSDLQAPRPPAMRAIVLPGELHALHEEGMLIHEERVQRKLVEEDDPFSDVYHIMHKKPEPPHVPGHSKGTPRGRGLVPSSHRGQLTPQSSGKTPR